LNLLQALFLGVLQGATEFLPVSSSGHLVLVPWLLGWPSPGLAFDAVVHWGTALAVVIYFWEEWVRLVGGALLFLELMWRRVTARSNPVADQKDSAPGMLAWLILVGTVPGVMAGFFLEDFFAAMFARPAAAAGFLLVTAALLVAAERLGRRRRDLDDLQWVDALVIGAGQALAILPGISRSGATIAAGLTRGMRREPAAHFSFLLATPIILGAGLLKLVEMAQMEGFAAQVPALIVGFVTSAVVGFACVHLLLSYLQKRRLYPFAAYCALFGLFTLLVLALR
jgi:undecaprenyl-diphosphatase